MVPTTRAVRKADQTERDAIVAIDDVAIGGDDDRSTLLETAIQSGHCLVLDGDHGISGFVVTVPKGFFGRDFVELLMVDRSRRRAGVGRQLLRAAVDSGSTNRVFTSTNASNWPMRTLLEHDGWTVSGELLGLDVNDPEIVYFTDRPATPSSPSSPSTQQPTLREPSNRE
jgi:GNAT superfamily N-acetyltransferase